MKIHINKDGKKTDKFVDFYIWDLVKVTFCSSVLIACLYICLILGLAFIHLLFNLIFGKL